MNLSATSNRRDLRLLVALSVGACAPVDHPVGAEPTETLRNGSSVGVTTTTTDGTSGTEAATDGTGGSDAASTGGSDATTDGTSGTGAAAGADAGASGTDAATNGTGGMGAAAGDSPGASGTNGNGAGATAGVDFEQSVTASTGGSALSVLNACGSSAYTLDATGCEFEAECVVEWRSSRCVRVGDALDCECGTGGPEASFRVTGVTAEYACYYSTALCMTWPELDAEPYVCDLADEVDDPDGCVADGECTREGVIDDVHFTEFHHRQSDCTDTADGWACGCGTPNGGIFRLPTATSDPQCVDGFGWCVGEGVERTGERTCVPTGYQWVKQDTWDDGDTRFAEVQCESPATLSGQEGTMIENDFVACRLNGAEGHYICRCAVVGGPDSRRVEADDLETALVVAATACESP